MLQKWNMKKKIQLNGRQTDRKFLKDKVENKVKPIFAYLNLQIYFFNTGLFKSIFSKHFFFIFIYPI